MGKNRESKKENKWKLPIVRAFQHYWIDLPSKKKTLYDIFLFLEIGGYLTVADVKHDLIMLA